MNVSRPATARDHRAEPAGDEAAMAGRLRLSATRLARRLRQQSDSGLTPTQLSALATADRHGPLTLGDLAQHELVAPPTITRVVAKLEAEGLVTRTADPEDRRSSLVTSSEAGRTLIEATRTRKDAWLASRIAALDADDRAHLEQALDALDHLSGQDDS